MSPSRWLARALFFGGALVLVSAAADAGAIRKLTLDPDAEAVGLFEGIEQERITARVAAKNQYAADVFLTNTTDKPLTVAIPPAVAAVHELKQFAPAGGLGLDNGFGQNNLFGNNLLGNNGLGNNGLGMTQTGAGQSLGGQLGAAGFPGNGPGGFPNFQQNPMGNKFPGQNFFSIPAGKTVQLRLDSVCLDLGNPDPMPGMRYGLRRLDDVVSEPAVRALLVQSNPQRTDRKALQAAVWHLRHGGRSWSRLAAQTTGRLPFPAPYFTSTQLQAAQQMVAAVRTAEETTEPHPTRTTASRR